jgi:hypothetical protein
MIKLITKWIEAIKNYDDLMEEYLDLTSVNMMLTQDVRLSKIALEKYKKPDLHDARVWDGRYKQSSIFYYAPKRKKVQEYLKYREIKQITTLAEDIIAEYGLTQANPDNVPLCVLKWLKQKFDEKLFTYKLDDSETWNDPEFTLQYRVGDCDDWGILQYFIIRQIFKTFGTWEQVKHRLKCVTGNVCAVIGLPFYTGGHFYLIWLNIDKEWYTLETTYYRERSINHWGEKPHKLDKAYGNIWFTFNEDLCWSHNMVLTALDWKKDENNKQ